MTSNHKSYIDGFDHIDTKNTCSTQDVYTKLTVEKKNVMSKNQQALIIWN